MDFLTWLENLKLRQEVPADPMYKDIWVNQPNNQQQVKSWEKNRGLKVYEFPLASEKFIHFTLKETVPQIIQSKQIGFGNAGVFAVSTNYGIWFPTVQFNHIMSKRKEMHLLPQDLRKPKFAQRMREKGWTQPNYGQEIAAVIFTTNQKPRSANAEEVVWDDAISLTDVKQLSTREAIQILKHTPHTIGSNDLVKYI